jgi:hypothetical protein
MRFSSTRLRTVAVSFSIFMCLVVEVVAGIARQQAISFEISTAMALYWNQTCEIGRRGGHSVRGFISGALGKKLGIKVESAKCEGDGEHVYTLAK